MNALLPHSELFIFFSWFLRMASSLQRPCVCVCVCVCVNDWLAVSCAASDVVSAVGNPIYLSALSCSLHPSASVSLQYDVSAGVSSALSPQSLRCCIMRLTCAFKTILCVCVCVCVLQQMASYSIQNLVHKLSPPPHTHTHGSNVFLDKCSNATLQSFLSLLCKNHIRHTQYVVCKLQYVNVLLAENSGDLHFPNLQ